MKRQPAVEITWEEMERYYPTVEIVPVEELEIEKPIPPPPPVRYLPVEPKRYMN